MNKSHISKLSRRMYVSTLLFVFDWILLFVANEIDHHLNHGNFFSNINAWRWGVLGLPLVILGAILGVVGLKQAKGIKILISLVGLILCLVTIFYLCWVIANTNDASYWGA